MKRNLLIILCCLPVLLSAQAKLQVPDRLESLTNQALANFPKMQSLAEMVRLSDLKTDMSSAGYLPIVSVDASYLYLHPTSSVAIPLGPGITKSFQMNPGDNYSAMLNVIQPLLDFKTSANVDRAKSDVAVSEATRESYRSQLAFQVAQIYYGIIFLNKSIAVQKLQLELVKSNLAIIDAKLKNGDALTYDLVTTQVRYTNIENAITDLETQLAKQYTLLNMLTGNTGVAQIDDASFSSRPYDAVRDSVFAIALQSNTDLLLAQGKVTYSQNDLTVAKRGFLPTLSLIASAGYKNGFAPTIFDINFSYDYGISLSVPILPASRPHIQTEMAEVGLAASQDELAYQKVSLTKDVRNALDEIAKNEKKYRSMDTLLIQAKMAVDLGTERYKEGVITNVELLTAETNYQDALLSKLQTEYSLLLSKLELNRLAGQKWW